VGLGNLAGDPEIVNLLSVDGDVVWSFDSQANLVASDLHDSHLDNAADDDRLIPHPA
jgi:hypothetical protein